MHSNIPYKKSLKTTFTYRNVHKSSRVGNLLDCMKVEAEVGTAADNSHPHILPTINTEIQCKMMIFISIVNKVLISRMRMELYDVEHVI